jgi:hypothetical protein
VLLLDEPFGALDAKIREELRRGIREIQRAVGITTMLVTHDQDEAFSMADRIGVMDRGRLQEVGEPRSLYQRPGTRFVATFLGGANLLLGPYGYRDVRLGESYFEVDRWSEALRSGDEAAVVVRPEDVVLAPMRDLLSVPVVGMGKVVELKFGGSSERLRLEMNAMETLASAQRPGAPVFTIEAVRGASEVDAMPLSVGQKVYVGFKHMHALPTPISSLRLVASAGRTADNISRTPLVRELAERMHIEPLYYDDVTRLPEHVRGLPILAADSTANMTTALDLLSRGARQVLMLTAPEPFIERMLIYVEPSSFGRDSVLAAAASLARHLPIDVGMLVRDEEDDGYRDLLDLRNLSLNQHGLDIRTETFRGNATDAVRERLVTSDAQTLLVVGLSAPERCSELVEDLQKLLREQPPAAVLFVSGRDKTQTQSQSYATAFSL